MIKFLSNFFKQTKQSQTQKPKKDPVKELLDLIAKHESNGNYNVVYGGKDCKLVNKTLKEVYSLQSKMVQLGSKSSAVGRYQFIHKTLKELCKKLKVSDQDLFSEKVQDNLATELLNRRGLQKYLLGDMSLERFMTNLSREWASLPKDMSGKSYYDGDGLNRALVKPEEVVAVLKQIKV